MHRGQARSGKFKTKQTPATVKRPLMTPQRSFESLKRWAALMLHPNFASARLEALKSV
jgi:hypothetical protein